MLEMIREECEQSKVSMNTYYYLYENIRNQILNERMGKLSFLNGIQTELMMDALIFQQVGNR